jgi:hypothetical protein
MRDDHDRGRQRPSPLVRHTGEGTNGVPCGGSGPRLPVIRRAACMTFASRPGVIRRATCIALASRLAIRRSASTTFLLLAILVAGASAQEAPPWLAHAHMHSILEKTFLRIDVLALDLCVDSATAVTISTLTAAPRTRALEDSVARVVLDAPRVVGQLRFLRNVSYSEFLGGIMDEQKHAVDAGLLADSTRRNVSASLPDWFSFLENRNIRENEQLVYGIHGDSVRMTYVDLAGQRLLDRVDTGPWRRASVLATWVAPGSGFRKGLMQSAWNPVTQSGSACNPS